MLVRAVLERVLEIFLVGHPHLFRLGVGILLDEFEPLGAACDIVDSFQFVEILLGDAAQCAGTLLAVVGPETSIDFFLVLQDPFEDRARLRMV